MSIAGGSGTSPDTYTYQNGFALYQNGSVIWAPQYWYENTDPIGYEKIVGDGDYFKFYGRIDRDDANDKNVFHCWNHEGK